MISNQSPKRAALFLFALCNVFVFADFVNAMDVVREPTSSMRGGNGRVKGRRLSETIYAWRNFEAAFAQERKKDDSFDESDIKKCEKMAEKKGITCTPSAMPSSAPSVAPSVSMAPSLSSAPSLSPSRSPTAYPTRSPSESPTKVPSVSPTNYPTGQPSVSPTIAPTTLAPTGEPFESLVLTRDDGSLWIDNSCRSALPASASTPQSQATTFEYFLQISPGFDLNAKISEVEQALSTAMAEEVLNTCSFGTSDTFETYGVTSLPIDVPSEGKDCPENVQMSDADCYVVTGGFTPTIFYMQGRRHLKVNRYFSSQAQSDIVALFGPILQNLLDSDQFIGNGVLKTTYSGFIVNDNVGSLPQISGEVIGSENDYGSDLTTVSIKGDASSAGGGGKKVAPGYVGGAISICLALIALIVVSAVLLQRRKDAKLKREFEMCEDDGGFDLDGVVEIDSEAEPTKYDTRSVRDDVPESYPQGNNKDRVQQGDAGSLRSGPYTNGGANPGDSSVIEARRAVSGLSYSVVDDGEATFDQSMDISEETDPHDYTICRSATCFKCRARKQNQPTFVKADLTSTLHSIQDELGPNKYKPKYPRKYKTDDTVDL